MIECLIKEISSVVPRQRTGTKPAIYIKDKAVIVLLWTEYGLLLHFTAYTVPSACLFFSVKESGTLETGSVLAQLCEK